MKSRRHGVRFEGNVIKMLEISTDFAALCRSGKISEINRAGRSLLGVERETAVDGLNLADLVDEDYRDVIAQLLSINVVETHPTPVRLRRLDGSVVEVSLLIHPARELGAGSTVVTARDISREGKLARSARDKADRFHLLVENSMHLICQCRDQRIVYLNPAGMRMLNLPHLPDDMPIWDVFSDEYRALFSTHPELLLDEGGVVPVRLRRTGGELFDANVLASRLSDSRDASDFMLEARDITAHNRAVAALRRTNDTLEQRVVDRTHDLTREKALVEGILQAVPNPVWWKDADGAFLGSNRAFRDLFSFVDSNVVGRKMGELFPKTYADLAAQAEQDLQCGHVAEYEVSLPTSSLGPRHMVVRKTAWQDGEQAGDGGVIGVMSDITERKQMEADLLRLATTDPLTGCSNRRHFMECAVAEAQRCHRYRHDLSVLMLDIDYFKRINDSFGHPVGDLAIRALVEVCRDLIRQEDLLGRLGGEEFAILLPETDQQGALRLAERLLRNVAEISLPTEAGRLSMTVSIGVCARSLGKDVDVEAMLSSADKGLYQAKQTGRNRVCLGA